MSYPINLDKTDLELFSIVRFMDKQKVLDLLNKMRSKEITVDQLITVVNAGIPTHSEAVSNRRAISFILDFIAKSYPTVKIPPELGTYLQTASASEKTTEIEKKVERRSKSGEITPQKEYTLPILDTLIKMGGTGKMSDILAVIFKTMKDKLTPEDLEVLSSGTGTRWKNKAQWERLRMINEGYLKTGSPRGVWEITNKGRTYYGSLKGEK